ncbi:MAG TPA: energy transducer TonB [Pseudomonadales bacterium]|nr:energy transducer TonB [Pseudomonadales bacterium]
MSPARCARGVCVLLAVLLLSACVARQDTGADLQWVQGARPVYPARAKAEGVEGYVVVEYRVNVRGEVEDARVVEAEPAGAFDAAALTAIRTWKYRPYLRGGVAEAVEGVRSTFEFRLGDPYPGL